MSVPAGQSCSNCLAWIIKGTSKGECRRHPPTVLLTGRFESASGYATTMTAPPAETSNNYWCYEWTDK